MAEEDREKMEISQAATSSVLSFNSLTKSERIQQLNDIDKVPFLTSAHQVQILIQLEYNTASQKCRARYQHSDYSPILCVEKYRS
jgi:hypothetical protein